MSKPILKDNTKCQTIFGGVNEDLNQTTSLMMKYIKIMSFQALLDIIEDN